MTKMLPPMTPLQRSLVEDNVAFARDLARKRWEMAPDRLDFDDLVSLAYQGLVQAAMRFDPKHGDTADENWEPRLAFIAYAKQRIVGSILDWQKKDADHVPRSYRTDYKILQRAGYPDDTRSARVLAESTGLSVERIRMVVSAVEREPSSFDMIAELANEDDDEVLASHHNVEKSVLLSAVGVAIADRVMSLPEFQRVILALRYFEGLELQAIASELGASLAAVRDAHNSALEQVYEAMLAAVKE